MPERDVLIERLEKKLIEKEREIVELRRMLSEKTIFDEKLRQSIIDEIKRELQEEMEQAMEQSNIAERISDIESKIVELRRAVESLMGEVMYLKNELREVSERKEEVRPEDRRTRELDESLVLETSRSRVNDTLIISNEEQFNSEVRFKSESGERLKDDKEKRGLYTTSETKSKIKNEKSRRIIESERTESSEHSKVCEDEDDLIICD